MGTRIDTRLTTNTAIRNHHRVRIIRPIGIVLFKQLLRELSPLRVLVKVFLDWFFKQLARPRFTTKYYAQFLD